MAGPAKNARLSSVLPTPLAAVSSFTAATGPSNSTTAAAARTSAATVIIANRIVPQMPTAEAPPTPYAQTSTAVA